MQNNEQTREELYKFFQEKFNIDFKNYTPLKSRLVVDEMNKRLDEQLKIEKTRNERLTQEIYSERNRLMELTQEVYG